MKRVWLLALIIVVLTQGALGQPAPQAKTIFIFHSDEFRLNLHHFLYVLGRAENKTRDSSRSAVVNAPKDQVLCGPLRSLRRKALLNAKSAEDRRGPQRGSEGFK